MIKQLKNDVIGGTKQKNTQMEDAKPKKINF